MKRHRWRVFIIVAFSIAAPVSAQPTTPPTSTSPVEITDSPNKKFRVVIESIPNSVSVLQASMVKIDDTPVTQWVTHIKFVRLPYRSPNTFVSDKGDFFARITSYEGDIALFHKERDATVILETSRFGPNLYSFADR